jgi:hypothetical protein
VGERTAALPCPDVARAATAGALATIRGPGGLSLSPGWLKPLSFPRRPPGLHIRRCRHRARLASSPRSGHEIEASPDSHRHDLLNDHVQLRARAFIIIDAVHR